MHGRADRPKPSQTVFLLRGEGVDWSKAALGAKVEKFAPES
jgi:hypothetical protein